MITIPLADIKQKIKEQSKLSDVEINNKIKAKLEDLSGLISEEGAAHIIANDLGIKLVQEGEKLKIKNVLSGMKNIEISGKVTRKYDLKEFKTEKRSGKLASFAIADETGFIRVVMWNEKTDEFDKFNEGDILTLQGGYVRDNNDRKEIHLGDHAKIKINPAGISIAVSEGGKPQSTRKKLSELAEGDENVEVLATIVQVFDIRFFEVDGDNGKRAIQKEGKYYAGEKEVTNLTYAYVMNLFIDDGTNNVRCVLWRNQIQKLLKLSHEEIVKFRDDPVPFEPMKKDLLGTIVKIVGRVNKNVSFDRLELVANLIFVDVDPEEEIKKLKAENATKDSVKENKPTSEKTEKIINSETKKQPPVQQEQSSEAVEEAVKNAEEDFGFKEETLSIDDLEDMDN
ncbi:MAG: OB-fold nucleic acid binding domain-containing protein [archaeon]